MPVLEKVPVGEIVVFGDDGSSVAIADVAAAIRTVPFIIRVAVGTEAQPR